MGQGLVGVPRSRKPGLIKPSELHTRRGTRRLPKMLAARPAWTELRPCVEGWGAWGPGPWQMESTSLGSS